MHYLGVGDLYNVTIDHGDLSFPIGAFTFEETKNFPGHCIYTLSMYETAEYAKSSSKEIIIIVCVTVGAFIVLAITFVIYGRYVNSRNEKIVHAAARSDTIISSLFPTQVRDRIFTAKDECVDIQPSREGDEKARSKTKGSGIMYETKPIADLYTDTTVLFADIAGFTAWSSTREPIQVFMLLEMIYSAFDEIAKRRQVFKVETIGDCYVAVTGLPTPRKDHAAVMALFAHECMMCMRVLVNHLKATMGPDTGDLAMRMGIHSGPVTAGVLRGENSRFQLFGDTMTTATQMEKHGVRERIQISEETAKLLISAGKTTWVAEREDGKRYTFLS